MLAFHCLGLAIASLWVSNTPWLWNSLLLIAAGLAMQFGFLEPAGLGIVFIAAASAYGYYGGRFSGRVRIGFAALMVVVSMGLMAHILPGFPVHSLYVHSVLTPGAYPTSLYWCFDKPIAGLVLLGWGTQRIRTGSEWGRILPATLLVFVACAGLILMVAWPLGLIRWAPKPASLTGLFTFTNLFFVCVPEEAFFRGFLQKKLSEAWVSKPKGGLWALLITSLIFGICHFKGGAGLILLASVAGVFYGYAYQRTGRVEAGILVHLLLNATHYAFFTYPVLKLQV